MSAQELRQIYEMYRQQHILNINCGILRGIGKTECLIHLMLECPITIRRVLIVRTQNERRQYLNVDGLISLICITSSEVEQYFRGNNNPTYVYADEVPNAQELIENLHRDSIRFIAGFYSDFESLYRQEDRNIRRNVLGSAQFINCSAVYDPTGENARLDLNSIINSQGSIMDRYLSGESTTTFNSQPVLLNQDDIDRTINEIMRSENKKAEHIKNTVKIKLPTINKMKFISR